MFSRFDWACSYSNSEDSFLDEKQEESIIAAQR